MIRNLIKKIYNKFPNVRIYTFHHLEFFPEICNSKCVLDTEDFYRFISKREKFISIMEMLDNSILKSNNASVITFDDGLKDVYTIAYPFLKNRRIPFTVFVLTDMLNQPGYITTEELIEMSEDSLITIGLHGKTHKVLTMCNKGELYEEVITAKKELEAIVKKEINIFAYSHGSYNNDAIEMIKKAGLCSAFTVSARPYNIFEKINKYYLPRYNIDSTTINKFVEI